MSIVINTPNGHIGRALAHLLLDADQKLTIISRSPEKVADLVARGARVVEGSIDEAATLDKALVGAQALFWLSPPAARPDFREWAPATGRLAAEAVKRHGVSHVVFVSSIGAHNGPGTGPVSTLKPIEEAFEAAAPNVVSLRCGFFMENLLNSVHSIAQAGAIFMPVAPDKTMPYVATQDIAATAARYLLSRSWTGHHKVGVQGPQDLSSQRAAEVIGEVLGRPVNYVPVTLEQARQGMLGAGLPDFVVDLYIEMYGAIPKGLMDPAEARSPETTTTTSLRVFAQQVIKPAVEGVGRG